jgi:ribosomal-protein-alanine N-acetyltransferase
MKAEGNRATESAQADGGTGANLRPRSAFLQGERLYLREVRLSDANDNYYHWMNDPEVTRYLESRFTPNSLDLLREYVEARMKDKDQVFLAIVLKAGDRHIGNVKLGPIHWIHRFADLGILIGEKDCWGNGYATDAIQLATEYAFRALNLQKLTASCYADNGGSIKAFQKAGWEIEGVRKQQFYSEGSYTNQILMAKIRPQAIPGA